MSRRHTVAKRRRAHKEARRVAHKSVRQAKFDESRETLEGFAAHLRELVKKEIPIWPLARATHGRLSDEERDLVARSAGPHLTETTPPAARLRMANDREEEKLYGSIQYPVSPARG